MKNPFPFLSLFLSAAIFSQSDTSTFRRAEELILRHNSKSITVPEKKELYNHIYSIQNKGFLLEENQGDNAGALPYINQALDIWIRIHDTLSEANLRKYKGLLLARLGKFSEGKTEMRMALRLYASKNNLQGIAVSNNNFSKLYDIENKNDSALLYAFAAKEFWKSISDTFRIVTSNNDLIHVLCKSGNFSRAWEIQEESAQLLKSKAMGWHPLLNFYYVSWKTFEGLKNNKKAESHQKLYSEKIEALKKDGIAARSIYE